MLLLCECIKRCVENSLAHSLAMNAELQELYRALINSPQRLQDEYNAKHSVLNTGALPTTVTTRRKRKRAPTMPSLSEKEDRKRRMKKRHWYEDKFGDLSKFV